MNSMEASLDQIVAGSRNGNRLAQHQLYERFHQRVYALAARFVGGCDAADLTQEIFLRVFAALDSFGGRADFSTWLYRVAINECLRYRRAARSRCDTLTCEPIAQDQAPERRLELADLLEHALGLLEPSLRAVFLLRHVEGMDYKQISAILGIPVSTAATRLGRARAVLQRLLKGIEQVSSHEL